MSATPPAPPAGLTRQQVAFTPGLEPARLEWFVTGTERTVVEAAGEARTLPRISSPAHATVIALDPDIPPPAQKVPLRARGDVAGLSFHLDGVALGQAVRPVLWSPVSGVHRLALVDATGRTVDRIQFTVH